MKLPDFLLERHFNSLRVQMGAPLCRSFKVTPPPAIDLEIVAVLRKTGVEASLTEISVLGDGTLSYKGYRVLVYIRDVANYGDRESLPRYHVSFCKMLDRMRQNNRWARYVVANRDDGNFLINMMGEESRARVERLDVCQYCLDRLKWQGFKFNLDKLEKKKRVQAFDLRKFFEAFPRDLISIRPEHSSNTAPINDYPADWGDISNRFKKKAGYACQGCRSRLTLSDSRFLHVHHKNGLKHDCKDSNLEVLCIRCHAEEPMHAHLKATPGYKEYVSRTGK